MNFNFNFTKTIETLKSKVSRVAVRSDRDSFQRFEKRIIQEMETYTVSL